MRRASGREGGARRAQAESRRLIKRDQPKRQALDSWTPKTMGHSRQTGTKSDPVC